MKKLFTVLILLITCVFNSYSYTISNKGKKQIMTRESCSLTVYKDNTGYSIGYGHKLKKGENYKKISKAKAEINDYYLINNLILRNNEQVICQIDHCLFGEKFIYVIKDRYYRGAIKGDKEDNIWIFYDKKGKTFEMENPMKVNELRVEKLSLMTQIDSSFFISIVVINDDAIVKNMENMSSNDSYIVSRKKLPKLIKSIESRDVRKIDEKQLNFAVQDISRLYGSQVEQDE